MADDPVLNRINHRMDIIELANREREHQRAKERKAAGICACGNKVEDCRPEICTHRFAHDAMWGN